MKYAANTNVSCEKSRAEIEKTLMRYGAEGFMYGWEGERAVVAFRMMDRQVKFVLNLPCKDDSEFTTTPSGRERKYQCDILKAWEQACRQRWRALALCIKAKLEACESGITTFDDEFMAHLVLPNGKTMSQFMIPQLEEIYKSGKMPKLLMG